LTTFRETQIIMLRSSLRATTGLAQRIHCLYLVHTRCGNHLSIQKTIDLETHCVNSEKSE